MMEEMIIPGTNIRLEDIVWAKIAGYPWWPGRVVGFKTDQSKLLVAVNFIGDQSHAYLGASKLVDYKMNREKHSKTKNKTLLKAISEADRIIEFSLNTPLTEAVKVTKEVSRKRQHKDVKVTKNSSGKRLKTLEDASNWLEELVNSEKVKADASFTKKFLNILGIISEKATSHEPILEKRIGINLNKLIELYEDDIEYSEIIKKAEETQEGLKDIVFNTYFGSNTSFHKDTLNKSTMNSGNQQETEEIKFYLPIVRKESPLMINECSLENPEKGEELQIADEYTPVDLRANVCQEIAKFAEGVE